MTVTHQIGPKIVQNRQMKHYDLETLLRIAKQQKHRARNFANTYADPSRPSLPEGGGGGRRSILFTNGF